MKTTIKSFLFLSILGTATVAPTSCSKNYDPDMGEYTEGIKVMDNPSFGKIMTNDKGRTLYFFANDSKGISTCLGNCLNTWQIFYDPSALNSKMINKSEVAEITRSDGKKQTTYKGWPLYYFVGDSNSNDVKGDAVNNIWYVAKPDYLLMVNNAQLIGDDGINYKSDYTPGDAMTIYFTDGKGRTLYGFAPDKFNTNTFTKSDFSNDPVWPIFQEITGELPSIISKTDIAVVDVFGKKQLSYRGWPLYYFGKDSQRGDNKGISFPRPAVWPIVNHNTAPAPSA